MLAYLDAGSASVAASVVAAGAAGVGVAARSVLGKFKRSPKATAEADSGDTAPAEDAHSDH
jgi:hypothetical protein